MDLLKEIKETTRGIYLNGKIVSKQEALHYITKNQGTYDIARDNYFYYIEFKEGNVWASVQCGG